MSAELLMHLTQTQMIISGAVAVLLLGASTTAIVVKNKKRKVVRKTESELISEAKESLKDKTSDAVAENPVEFKSQDSKPQILVTSSKIDTTDPDYSQKATRIPSFAMIFAGTDKAVQEKREKIPKPTSQKTHQVIANTQPASLWKEEESKVPDWEAPDLMNSAFIFDATGEKEQALAYLRQALRVVPIEYSSQYTTILAHYEDIANKESLKNIHDRIMHQPAVDVVVNIPEHEAHNPLLEGLNSPALTDVLQDDDFSRVVGIKTSQSGSPLLMPESLPLEKSEPSTSNDLAMAEFLNQYKDKEDNHTPHPVVDEDILLLQAFKNKEQEHTTENALVQSLVPEDKIEVSLTVLERALENSSQSTIDPLVEPVQDSTYGSPELESFMHDLAQESHEQDKEIEQQNADDERKIQLLLEQSSSFSSTTPVVEENKPLVLSAMKLAVHDHEQTAQQKAMSAFSEVHDSEKYEVWVNWAERTNNETIFHKDFFEIHSPWGTKEAMQEIDELLKKANQEQTNWAVVSVFEIKK